MKKSMMLIQMSGVFFAMVLFQGCHSLHPVLSDEKIIEEGFAVLKTKPCIAFHWYGENEWRLDETGWGGGGHFPYDVYLRTDPQFYRPIKELMFCDGPIRRDPNLLLPLFESSDTETILRAMYVFQKTYYDYDSLKKGHPLTSDVHPVAGKIRFLMNRHRDVRVRCMAAHTLLMHRFLVLEDIETMLNDSNLSVRIMGVDSVNSVCEQINKMINPVFQECADDERDTINRKFEAINQELISLLLMHLNDNHYYIRSSCYDAFLSQTGNISSAPYWHFYIGVPQTYLKSSLWWAHESWKARHELQGELISWWESNKERLQIESRSL